MHSFLKQSTASQTRTLGPFLDDTDGKTAETGLTIANTDVKLQANGGTAANKSSGGGTHRANGNYAFTFDATDTATVGELYVSCKVSGALQVVRTFCVLEEAVYDALFGASAAGYVQPSQLPTNFADLAITSSTGRVTVGTNNDKTGYSLSNLTVESSTTLKTGDHQPQSGDAYARLGAPAGANVSEDVAAINSKTTNLPASPAAVGSLMNLADGAITADKIAANAIAAAKIADDAITAAKVAADAIGSSQLASSAVSEIQSGLATAAKMLAYVRLLARKDSAIATDHSTELGEINADVSSGAGSYDNTSDSGEGIRDTEPLGTAMRGTDSAYTGTPPTAAAIADQVWDEATGDHTTADTFGAKNQNAVPSETLNDYKADVSGLSTFDPTYEVETDLTWEQFQRLMFAALAGLSDGADTATMTFKAAGHSSSGTTRITATVDADGNRSAVVLNP